MRVSKDDAVQRQSAAPAVLTLAGLAAAFAAASCCGLPLLLASLGIGSAWLAGLAVMAAPNRLLLLVLGAVGLASGSLLLWRQWRAASCTASCGKPALRGPLLAGLLIGLVLLYLGYAYA